MDKSQKLSSHVSIKAFIDYKPAELCVNSQWLVVFYAKNPLTNKLERFRLSVPMMKSKSERIKQGKKIALEVNKKLESGWLPYYSDSESSEFKTFEHCADKFISQIEKDVKKGTKRKDTLKSYQSGIAMIKLYLQKKEVSLKLVLEINRAFINKYLDWIYYERNSASVTYNNHLIFMGIFLNFCIERGYVRENYTIGIPKKIKEPKQRQIISDDVRGKLKELQSENKNYFTLCMATYFCFLRSTELTKIKVGDVNLKNSFITVKGEYAKNKKTQNITIPENFGLMLADHIRKAKRDDFLFSGNDFMPGAIQLIPKKIYDTWVKFRKQKNISDEYHFYSLKDTGITDLMNHGIPSIKVRDQARHYDIKITETYMARNKTSDDAIRTANLAF